jgi:hypothetical protein
MKKTYFSPTFSDRGDVIARTMGGSTSEDAEQHGGTAHLKTGSLNTASGTNPSGTGVED